MCGEQAAEFKVLCKVWKYYMLNLTRDIFEAYDDAILYFLLALSEVVHKRKTYGEIDRFSISLSDSPR